jgi:hypothetical protein
MGIWVFFKIDGKEVWVVSFSFVQQVASTSTTHSKSRPTFYCKSFILMLKMTSSEKKLHSKKSLLLNRTLSSTIVFRIILILYIRDRQNWSTWEPGLGSEKNPGRAQDLGPRNSQAQEFPRFQKAGPDPDSWIFF